MSTCRTCEREHDPSELTPSGICADCLPSTAGTGRRPAGPPPPIGPGRQAVRDLLAPMRAARAAAQEQTRAALAGQRPTDLSAPIRRSRP